MGKILAPPLSPYVLAQPNSLTYSIYTHLMIQKEVYTGLIYTPIYIRIATSFRDVDFSQILLWT